MRARAVLFCALLATAPLGAHGEYKRVFAWGNDRYGNLGVGGRETKARCVAPQRPAQPTG